MTRAIQSLNDLRPGDIMLTTMPGFIPGTFPVRFGEAICKQTFRVGTFTVDHAGIVTSAPSFDRPRLVQAMPHGAEEIELTDRYWNDRTVFVRIPEDYTGQGQDAAAIARAMIGIPYSFGSYAAIAAYSRGLKVPALTKWIDRRQPYRSIPLGAGGIMTGSGWLPVEAICSVLVDQAWSLAGKRIMIDTAPQAVSPGALGIRLWEMSGVEWGGAALL